MVRNLQGCLHFLEFGQRPGHGQVQTIQLVAHLITGALQAGQLALHAVQTNADGLVDVEENSLDETSAGQGKKTCETQVLRLFCCTLGVLDTQQKLWTLVKQSYENGSTGTTAETFDELHKQKRNILNHNGKP